MVKDSERLARFEQDWLINSPHDPKQNLAIFESMRQLAVASGVLPGPDPLEGIEVDVRLARDLRATSSAR
jgi:hypothetical protein